MTRHVIGDFEFEILREQRFERRVGDPPIVDMIGRPRPDIPEGDALHQFDIRRYHKGQPLPHEERDFPAEPHREIFEWSGRIAVDVYEEQAGRAVRVGTKRGADFRSRFWPTLLMLADKAVYASASGRSIGDIEPTEPFPHTRMTREPVDLKSRTLEEAAAELTR